MSASNTGAIAQKEMASNKAGHESTVSHNNTCNSARAQCSRLLAYLLRNVDITTLEARKKLDVLHPAMRILELRADGHRIDTVWVHQATDCGKVHRVACGGHVFSDSRLS